MAAHRPAAPGRSLADRVLRGLPDDVDHVELRREASERLRGIVGFDLAVWAVLDPATVMWGSCVLDGAPRDTAFEDAVFANEYGVADDSAGDVLKLADLAAGPLIGTLHTATGGDRAVSARYRDVLSPRGFTDELRLVMHDGRSAWGALCLLRAEGTFTATEVDELARLGRPFATLLRSALVRTAAGVATDAPAGLVLATSTGRMLEISDDARRLLGATGRSPDELPALLQALAASRAAGGPASAATPTPSGQWLTFHASGLGDRLAVVVEAARPHRLADLVVRSKGLTPREQDVLTAVTRGMSTRLIARELRVSEYTVADHLKVVFAKFGVSSRSELVATLFFDHLAPLHATM